MSTTNLDGFLVGLLRVLEITDCMVEVLLIRLCLVGDPSLELADGRVGGHAVVVLGWETERHGYVGVK